MPLPELKFISLKQAEQHCSYTADYLKLRARQGKLEAKKIGRAWVTTQKWVEEYADEMEEYKNDKWNNGKTKKITTEAKVRVEIKEETKPNLYKSKLSKPQLKFPVFPFAISRALPVVLIIVAIITSITLGKDSILPFYNKAILMYPMIYIRLWITNI